MSENIDGPATNDNTENNINEQVTMEDCLDDLEDRIATSVK